jgi:amino acid adenylation domain-containing protein
VRSNQLTGTEVLDRPTARPPDRPLSLGLGEPLPLAGRRPVHELVADLARSHPDRPAVRSAGSTLSYGELDAWAGRIAARLVAAGAGPGERVAVLAAPSTAMVAAVLGVLRAGAAYVPVDGAWPDRRLADVLADARVGSAVVAGDAGSRLAGSQLAGSGLPVIQAEDAAAAGGTAPGADLPTAAAADPAYLIYTSGSTGEPKGVLVTHGQLAASTQARRLVYAGPAVFLLVSPLAFDSSVAGLWGTLTAGGTLVVATIDEVRDAERLVDLVDREAVTRTLCVPSLYGVLLDAAERPGPARLGSLETVVVAGEPLPEQLLARHFALHRGTVALVNEYGPTETAVWASYRRYDAAGPVSIGGPIPGARLYVLDGDRRPVPCGVEGELFVGGAGVSVGYFGRPEATAQAFVADPWAGVEGARMYRTGDRVRWTDEGTLDFLGRRDHQVKIRGHRVELGAVEAALRTVPGVRDAAVVPNGARTALAGFVLADPGAAPESVRAQLADRLPASMVPARIRVLEHLPLTFTGKVDRAQLAAAADEEQPTATRPAADRAAADPTAGVAAAWTEVLAVADVPTDANFFDLGGHSLAMFKLQDALERHTGVRPSMVALFRHTTVAAQAALIRTGGAGSQRPLQDRSRAVARRAQAVRARRERALREAS